MRMYCAAQHTNKLTRRIFFVGYSFLSKVICNHIHISAWGTLITPACHLLYQHELFSFFKITVIVGKQGLKNSVKSHQVLFFSGTTILKSLCCLFKVVACALLRRFGTEGDFQYPSHFPLINEVIVSFFYGRNVIHSKQIEIMTWVKINFCYNFQ